MGFYFVHFQKQKCQQIWHLARALCFLQHPHMAEVEDKSQALLSKGINPTAKGIALVT